MSKNVLVADDDPVVRILISEFLAGKGYQVETLESGEECLRRLDGRLPDVLVLDLLMPDMTGIEVLRHLRDNPRTSALPIIMLSADTDTEALASANNVSANVYVQKPFGVKEIVLAMEKALSLDA